jgi:uncharacterized metal-binding protein YceD (DUF177 family)
MKIYVSRIPAEGLTDHAVYEPNGMDMDTFDVHPQPFEVEAFIAKTEQELVVRVTIRCPLRCSCARCLEEFSSTVTAKAVFSYQVKPTDIVDITEDVRQEIMLAYPMVPVCRPDCRGLCSSCGQNLNSVPCQHQSAGGGE